jgi:Ca2+-binding EF-hand superfamily protein
VKQVGEVLRALGQNPTESEVKKLVQTSCKVQVGLQD